MEKDAAANGSKPTASGGAFSMEVGVVRCYCLLLLLGVEVAAGAVFVRPRAD